MNPIDQKVFLSDTTASYLTTALTVTQELTELSNNSETPPTENGQHKEKLFQLEALLRACLEHSKKSSNQVLSSNELLQSILDDIKNIIIEFKLLKNEVISYAEYTEKKSRSEIHTRYTRFREQYSELVKRGLEIEKNTSELSAFYEENYSSPLSSFLPPPSFNPSILNLPRKIARLFNKSVEFHYTSTRQYLDDCVTFAQIAILQESYHATMNIITEKLNTMYYFADHYTIVEEK